MWEAGLEALPVPVESLRLRLRLRLLGLILSSSKRSKGDELPRYMNFSTQCEKIFLLFLQDSLHKATYVYNTNTSDNVN